MVVVLSDLPKGGPREGVELAARSARREDSAVHPDVALQNSREHISLEKQENPLDYVDMLVYIQFLV